MHFSGWKCRFRQCNSLIGKHERPKPGNLPAMPLSLGNQLWIFFFCHLKPQGAHLSDPPIWKPLAFRLRKAGPAAEPKQHQRGDHGSRLSHGALFGEIKRKNNPFLEFPRFFFFFFFFFRLGMCLAFLVWREQVQLPFLLPTAIRQKVAPTARAIFCNADALHTGSNPTQTQGLFPTCFGAVALQFRLSSSMLQKRWRSTA